MKMFNFLCDGWITVFIGDKIPNKIELIEKFDNDYFIDQDKKILFQRDKEKIIVLKNLLRDDLSRIAKYEIPELVGEWYYPTSLANGGFKSHPGIKITNEYKKIEKIFYYPCISRNVRESFYPDDYNYLRFYEGILKFLYDNEIEGNFLTKIEIVS